MSASSNVEEMLLTELSIDPFGAIPNWASRLSGLGGSDLPPDPGYVFRTVPVRPGLGPVTFSIQFLGLAATCGTLRIKIKTVSAFPGEEPIPLESLEMPLLDLLSKGGVIALSIIGRRNTLYEIAGYIIDDSDSTCDRISITADRYAPADEGERGWRRQIDLAPRPVAEHADMFIRSWITRLDPPNFDLPSSQGWTPAQARNPHFQAIAKELGLQSDPPDEAWGEAFILRTLEAYSAVPDDSSCIGFVNEPRPITSVFAARGVDLLLVEHRPDAEIPLDLGLSLERHLTPSLCDENRFFDHVFLTTANWNHIPPTLNERFDFLWSINSNRMFDTGHFIHFVLSSVNCLQPGGMAVHIFDFADIGATETRTDAIGRPPLEQLVAHALSHLNEVALLRFRRGKGYAVGSRSFGLILRKGIPR